MKKLFLILFVLGLLSSNAFAASVIVDYVYSGTPGDYLLNFEVTNNIPAPYNQKVYMWAVSATPEDPSRSGPSGWTLGSVTSGDGVIDYINGWYTDPWGGTPDYRIYTGASLSGFNLELASIPNEMYFLAWAWPYSDVNEPTSETDVLYSYLADDTYKRTADRNPCIVGTVGPGSFVGGGGGGVVPEPTSMVLFGIGLAGAALKRKKR